MSVLVRSSCSSRPCRPNRSPPCPLQPFPLADEDTLKSAPYRRLRAGAADFLHKRSGTAVEQGAVAGLVKQLADPVAAVHDAAAGQLVALGEAAVPAFRQAANNLDDPDVSARRASVY